MFTSIAFFLLCDDSEDSQSSSSDEEENGANAAQIRRYIRNHANPLELSTSEFKRNFRISKEAFTYLLKQLDPHFPNLRTTAVTPMLKLCAALRLFAEGSFKKCQESGFPLGLSQPTMSKVLQEVTNLMQEHICPKWIKSKRTQQELSQNKYNFYKKSGFPSVVGCVAATHVRILAPGKEVRHLYANDADNHSINVLIVCDYQMKILYVDASQPGSTTNENLWKKSGVRKAIINNLDGHGWLLGDTDFPLGPCLMTPFSNAAIGSPESRYNEKHSKAYSIVKHTINVLQSRFKCLSRKGGLYFMPERVEAIINSCCALYNLGRHFDDGGNGFEVNAVAEVVNSSDNINALTKTHKSAKKIRNEIMYSMINYEDCKKFDSYLDAESSDMESLDEVVSLTPEGSVQISRCKDAEKISNTKMYSMLKCENNVEESDMNNSVEIDT